MLIKTQDENGMVNGLIDSLTGFWNKRRGWYHRNFFRLSFLRCRRWMDGRNFNSGIRSRGRKK